MPGHLLRSLVDTSLSFPALLSLPSSHPLTLPSTPPLLPSATPTFAQHTPRLSTGPSSPGLENHSVPCLCSACQGELPSDNDVAVPRSRR